MKFPTIPHNFPWKTFREVFNRLLNAYCLENECAFLGPCRWGIGTIKKAEEVSDSSAFESLTQLCEMLNGNRIEMYS